MYPPDNGKRFDQTPLPYPTEFRHPTRPITPEDIEGQLRRYRESIRVDISPDGEPIPIAEGIETKPENQKGEVFVYWGEALQLHGTYMTPEALFEFLKPDVSATRARSLLLGDTPPQEEPIVRFFSPSGLVVVNVFAGATSQAARIISTIGDAGTFSRSERAQYQRAMHDVYAPLSLRSRKQTKTVLGLSGDDVLFHEKEDVAATADTLGGVGIFLERMKEQGGFRVDGRRIDVVSATGQSLAILGLEAHRFQLPTEINVGFMAWGLSEGIGSHLEHKNYIMHAPFPELLRVYGKTLFVCGDVGEAAQQVGGLPWEAFRQDGWGVFEGEDTNAYAFALDLEMPGSLRVGYANGGLLVFALADYALAQKGQLERAPRIMAVGKRIDGGKNGFALRIDKFLGPLTQYAKHRSTQP